LPPNDVFSQRYPRGLPGEIGYTDSFAAICVKIVHRMTDKWFVEVICASAV
jgi:hypothetical protein